jgi:hypothetical protein
MNKNKVKFKYLMNLWKSLPEYPTQEDIIYELSVYLEKDGRPNGEFTLKTFNSIYGNKWEQSSHFDIVNNMIKNNVFETKDEIINDKTKYRLKETPIYS